MKRDCVFCDIVEGRSPVSLVCEDSQALCFMTLRPTRLGECLVIPKVHIDHFVDVPTELLGHLIKVIRTVSGAIQAEFRPRRVGMVVHGFGVSHAHFILVPQHHPDDITSGRFAVVDDGEVLFRHDVIPERPRSELDSDAKRLRGALAGGMGDRPAEREGQ